MEEKKSKKQKEKEKEKENKKKEKEMPLAGRDSVSRAKAHMRWADRYERAGNAQKAGAHFGRALDYGAARFGIDEKKRRLDRSS